MIKHVSAGIGKYSKSPGICPICNCWTRCIIYSCFVLRRLVARMLQAGGALSCTPSTPWRVSRCCPSPLRRTRRVIVVFVTRLLVLVFVLFLFCVCWHVYCCCVFLMERFCVVALPCILLCCVVACSLYHDSLLQLGRLVNLVCVILLCCVVLCYHSPLMQPEIIESVKGV